MLRAIANFDDGYSASGYNITGNVIFFQKVNSSIVVMRIWLKGLPKGIHGIHVHEKEFDTLLNCTNMNCCDQLGGHFNPDNLEHGEHAGDLCFNIHSEGLDKVVFGEVTFDTISLISGNKYNIVNRSLIIHKDPDDEGQYWLYPHNSMKWKESKKTGNSGERISCANISILN